MRFIFRFGCLCKVLLPLELRRHKFDAYTEDCAYLGPCPDGAGTRFLRMRTKAVIVRKDVIVYEDTMPFRSMGGKPEAGLLAIASEGHWDKEEEEETSARLHLSTDPKGTKTPAPRATPAP